MTHEKFDTTPFSCKDKLIYKNVEYFIGIINYEERLFGLTKDLQSEEDDIIYVRCESVETSK